MTRGEYCLDNLFTNLCDDDLSVSTVEYCLSDHQGLLVKVSDPDLPRPSVARRITYTPITASGLFALYNYLETYNWSFIDRYDFTVDHKFDCFLDVMVTGIKLNLTKRFSLKQTTLNR